jgi:hypothetical protein
MNERLMFEELSLIKKEVTERFLSITRDVYVHHPVYTFAEDESVAKLFIYPSYGNPDHDGKNARMVVKVGAYNYHLMDTLNNNMSKEIVIDGVVCGFEHQQTLSIPLTVLVQAYAEEESSDLADELANLVVFACRNRYRAKGLITRGVQVSETDLYDNKQKIYQTTVAITMDVPWTTRMINLEAPIENIHVGVENEETITFDTYRKPGISISKENAE